MKTPQLTSIAILGAGSWGTALALYLAKRGYAINLWSMEITEITAMLAERENNRYLPGYPFPDLIHPTANLAVAVKDVKDIIIAVPSVGFRNTLSMLQPLMPPDSHIICATKGLDHNKNKLLHEVADEVLGKNHPFAILSGPSFALEVAAGLPAALTLACRQSPLLQELTSRLHSDLFHIHASEDVIGVEIGGIVKNVIALATGIADGMELGANARSALITNGLAEMIKLGHALGAQTDTLIGLSGLGDLILTCTDNQSRNRRLGLAIGKGQDPQIAEQEIGQAIEGKQNAFAITQLAKRHEIVMPICNMVCEILQGGAQVKNLRHQLLVGI